MAATSIKDRFDQTGYVIYYNLEKLLLKKAACSDLSEQLSEVSGVYHEVDACQLKLQLSNLPTYFSNNNITAALEKCPEYLQILSPSAKTFLSEVCTMARLILSKSATNVISECVVEVCLY